MIPFWIGLGIGVGLVFGVFLAVGIGIVVVRIAGGIWSLFKGEKHYGF